MSGDEPMRKAELESVTRELAETFDAINARQFKQSWYCAEAPERKRRLSSVVKLSVELERIRQTDRFSTLLGESAIGAVIEGDIRGVTDYLSWMTFKDALLGPDARAEEAKYEELWAGFRDILREFLREKAAEGMH